MVVPTVGASANSRLTASRAGLSINLSPGGLIPTGRTTTTGSTATDAARAATQPPNPPTAGSESTTTKSSTATLTEGRAPAPQPTAVDLSNFTSLDPGLLAAALADDPFRHFAAAAALRAQVQLLDARIRQAGAQTAAQPYLVQLEITANPRRRDLAYDLHSTISFELYSGKGELKPASLEIIPLFSNVDFERINLTHLAESIRQASLDVGATVGAVGLQAGGGAGAREQGRFVARNLNALTSVTRITGQEMDIRTGARWVGEDLYKLLAPSQTIVALMLVKKSVVDRRQAMSTGAAADGDVLLRTIARQQLVDGEDGEDLRLGDRDTYHGRIKSIVDSFNLQLVQNGKDYLCQPVDGNPAKTASNDDIPGLTALVSKNELGSDAAENARIVIQKQLADLWLMGDDSLLWKSMRCLSGDDSEYQNIRLELASLKRSTQYSIDTTAIPLLLSPKVPDNPEFAEQLVYYTSANNGITVKIGLNGNANVDGLQAFLTIADKKGPAKPKLFAQAISATDTTLTLTFPAVDGKKYSLESVGLKTGEHSVTTLPNLADAAGALTKPPDTRIILSTGLAALAADPHGGAKLLLTVNQGKDAAASKLRLTATGGQIAAVDGATRGKEGAFELGFGSTYALTLQNLVPGQIFILKGAALDASGEPVKDIEPAEEKLFIVPPAGIVALPQTVVAPNST